MNGPLPTGRVWTWSPVSRTALGDTMLSVPPAAYARKGAYGFSKLTCTVNSSRTFEPA